MFYLSACSPGHRAYEFPKKRQGAFFYHLVDCFERSEWKAGALTIHEAFTHAAEQERTAAQQELRPSDMAPGGQLPDRDGGESDHDPPPHRRLVPASRHARHAARRGAERVGADLERAGVVAQDAMG